LQSITEVITPARKKTQPQVRQSIVTGDTDDGGDDTNNRSSIDSGESPKKTPVVLNKVPITKRSTVRSALKIKIVDKVCSSFPVICILHVVASIG